MVNITLPDGSVRQYEQGITPLDIAKSISEGLARNVLAAKVNGKVVELYRPISQDATVQLLTWNDEEGKGVCRNRKTRTKAWNSRYPERPYTQGPRR